jgi:hypothetical protein
VQYLTHLAARHDGDRTASQQQFDDDNDDLVSDAGYLFTVRNTEPSFLTLKTIKKFGTRRNANEELMLSKQQKSQH